MLLFIFNPVLVGGIVFLYPLKTGVNKCNAPCDRVLFLVMGMVGADSVAQILAGEVRVNLRCNKAFMP